MTQDTQPHIEICKDISFLFTSSEYQVQIWESPDFRQGVVDEGNDLSKRTDKTNLSVDNVDKQNDLKTIEKQSLSSSSSNGMESVNPVVNIDPLRPNLTRYHEATPLPPALLPILESVQKNPEDGVIEKSQSNQMINGSDKDEKEITDKFTEKQAASENVLHSLSWRDAFNCTFFLSAEICKGEKDVREEFVFKYRYNQSKKLYLFVVNYHWDGFKTTEFVRNTMYKRINEMFPVDFDVIIMGPVFSDEYKVVNHNLRIGGEYSFYSIVRAYQFLNGLYSYDGYFFINDDAFVDPIRLQKYDFSRSFHEPTRLYEWGAYWSWNLLKNEFGVKYPIAFRAAIDEVIATPALEKRCHLKDLNNHQRGLQDFFYVTNADMPLFVKLADVFYKHRAFLEMAAPTISWCLSHQYIDSCNHHFWPNVTTCAHLHPVKFGHPALQNIAMQHINQKNIHQVVPMGWFPVCCIKEVLSSMNKQW